MTDIDTNTGRINGTHILPATPALAPTPTPSPAIDPSDFLFQYEPELTDNARSVLAARYLIRGADGQLCETPREMFARVACAIAAAEPESERTRVAGVFYGRMARLEFLPNTPCLVNAGRPGGFGQFSACFVIPIEDTMDSVFSAIRQMALTHKSGGGCIGGESVVLTDKGPMTMQSLVEGRRDVSVLSYTGGTSVADWRLVAQHHTTETDFVYEVDLDGQASIRASGWHPFFVWRGDRIDEVRADELVPGDAIVGSTRWNGRLSDLSMRAWLAGFVVSDGGFDESVNGLRLRICKGHEEPIRRAAEQIGCSYDLSNDQRYRSPVWELCKVGAGAREILDQFGEGPFDVYNKRLPSWTWLAPVHEQVSLLIGLLDGDGWIEPDSGDLAYGTVSQRLAMEVQALCGMLGIRTRRRDRAPDDGSNEASFCEITLARSPWLSDAVNVHSARHRMSWSHTRGVISLDRKYVGMLGEIGHPIHTNEAWRRGIEIDGHRVIVQRWRREGLATREVAALVLRDLGLETYASAVHSARIVRSVKTSGSDTLYDLTVPGTQNYVAGVGGFVVAHNTGFSFSRLRAAGRPVRTTSGVASGPISFMRPFNAATEATKQGGVRRGANMGVLRVDHPDILSFIRIKANNLREMENFNLSVGITDAFMSALDGDRRYALVHPDTGETAEMPRACDVWDEIVRCAHVVGDPGLVFLDRINALDPLTEALGPIEATNPCGEVPLRGNDACSLGSINLDKFIAHDTAGRPFVNSVELVACVRDSVRFLDDMITLSEYPDPRIREVVDQSRKIGLGVMGWADALIRLGVPYASKTARELADKTMGAISAAAIAASMELARERGPFGAWEQSRHCKEGRPPRRNGTCTVIAPTGSISIIAGCSSGIEPPYALSMTRDQAGMIMREVHPAIEREARVRGWWTDEVAARVRESGTLRGVAGAPAYAAHLFAIANEIEVQDHVLMQAAFQRHVEDGVSKTINLRNSARLEDIDRAYRLAWSAGCKGITVYRDGCRDKQVLVAGATDAAAVARSPAPAPAPAAPEVVLTRKKIPRDGRRSGHTITTATPFGSAHVTINEHPDDGEPFEVFVRIGKSGSEVMAWTEAFGRATSYLLAMPGPVSPRVRLEEIAQQLADIGGGSQIGIGPDAVVSAPDALAKILQQYLAGPAPAASPQDVTQLGRTTMPASSSNSRARRESNDPTRLSSAPPSASAPAMRLDLCPACGKATLSREQRCGLCLSCGFSKC